MLAAIAITDLLPPIAMWAVLIALLLIVVLVVVIVRRRRKRRAGGSAPTKTAKQPPLQLRGVWKRFVRGVPFQYRQALTLYQPFIVFGDVGAGKSTLIERCTDWQGLAAQFHPSYTEDPNLQIYQGSGALVEEHSATLLADTSASTRRELTKLWKRLKKGKSPRVVVVLRADVLLDESMESTIRRAQLVRGKLNILSSLLQRPIDVHIAVVRMDAREGYLEFSRYLHTNERELCQAISQEDSIGSIQNAAKAFEPYLPHASASLPAADYLATANFILGNGNLLGRIANFASVVTAYDPATVQPKLQNFVLSSQKNPIPLANPFAAVITQDEAERFRPVQRHRWRALALGAVCMGYLVAGFSYEKETIDSAKSMLVPLVSDDGSGDDDRKWQEFYQYLDSRKNSLVSRLLPSFKKDHNIFLEQEIHTSYLNGVRENVLLRKLRKVADSPSEVDQAKYLYLLAIVYGTSENATGAHVLSNLRDWERVTGLSESRISDFVSHNQPPFPRMLRLDAASLPQLRSRNESERWDQFFTDVERQLKNETSSMEELLVVQERSSTILGEIQELEGNSDLTEVVAKLKEDGELQLDPVWHELLSKLSKVDRTGAQDFLETVSGSEMMVIDPKLPLGSFLEAITPISNVESAAGAPRGDIRRHRSLTAVAWNEHLGKSRLAASLAGFVQLARELPAWDSVFLPTSGRYRPISLRGGTNLGVESREAVVAGVYTKQVFEAKFANVVASLPEVLKAIPLKDETKAPFKDFIVFSLGEYAGEYVDAYEMFYEEYQYTSISRTLLPYVAKRLSGRRSVLRTFLRQLSDNTQLVLPKDNEFADALFVIPESFSFVDGLLGNDSEQGPALAAYMDILKQFAATLGDKAPFVGDPKKDPAALLKEQLNPEGRVAIANYLNEEDAYAAKVDQWFDASGVPREYRYPFTGLFNRANGLGKEQIQNTIARLWKPTRRRLRRLVTKFPFNRSSDIVATRGDIEFLVPGGSFWLQFQDNFGSLLVQNDGTWKVKRSRNGKIALPARMLREVNALQRVSDLLWLDDGTPKPITLNFRPLPSATPKKNSLFPVMATFSSAEQKILAFNQKPAWHQISYDWSEPSSSSIDVVFAKPGDDQKSFRSLSISGELWSLYSLMKLAKHDVASSKLTWTVRGPKPSTAIIGFELRENPWDMIAVKEFSKASR